MLKIHKNQLYEELTNASLSPNDFLRIEDGERFVLQATMQMRLWELRDRAAALQSVRPPQTDPPGR